MINEHIYLIVLASKVPYNQENSNAGAMAWVPKRIDESILDETLKIPSFSSAIDLCGLQQKGVMWIICYACNKIVL